MPDIADGGRPLDEIIMDAISSESTSSWSSTWSVSGETASSILDKESVPSALS